MRRLYSDQGGQSLVIVAIAMLVMLGVAALTIDVGSWYTKRHQAQVAADAGALAAANCLATAACTSTAPNGDAALVATTIAAANGVPIPASDVSFTGNTVKVTAQNAAPSYFANVVGIHGTTAVASASASWTAGTTSCATAGSGCAAVFAMGSSCSLGGTPPGSPIIFAGSNDTIQGIVNSNGSIYEAGGGSQTLGPTRFGNGSGCEIDTSNESGDTWGGSSTMPTTGQAPITTWPDDYTQVVTNCGGSYPACYTSQTDNGNAALVGLPTYCTQAAANFTFGSGETTLTTGQVWCAYGTGTKSQPATWNGLLYFQSSASTATGNWIGGTVEMGENGFTLSPKLTSFPVLYATGSGDCSNDSNGGVCMTGGNETVNGAIFAPNGWIEFNGGSSTTDNFLEAQGIYFDGGSNMILGDGPTSLSGNSGGGTDSLTQ